MLDRRILTFVLLLTSPHFACSRAARRDIPDVALTAETISQHPVTGKLGLPLGTATEIEATIIAGRDLRMKEYEARYLLRVTAVAGRPLAEPLMLEFSVRGSAVLAADPFALNELKTGQESHALNSDQIAKLEEGYVGKHVRLLAYETGGYSGIPPDLPKDFPVWQGHPFAFTTSLVVLDERN